MLSGTEEWTAKKTKLHLLRGEKLYGYLLHVQLNCMASLTLQQGVAEGEYLVKNKRNGLKTARGIFSNYSELTPNHE